MTVWGFGSIGPNEEASLAASRVLLASRLHVVSWVFEPVDGSSMRAARDLRTSRSGLTSEGQALRSAEVGIRVRRGPDWDWDDQDGGGPGTTVPGADEDGWVSVRWDAGSEFKYRVGAGGNYDLIIDGASSPASPAAARILRCAEADVRVRRGRDWKWGDQDAGGLGVTLGMDGVGPGWVTVRWDQSGARGAYRVGAFGKFDLFVVESRWSCCPTGGSRRRRSITTSKL